MLRKNFFSKYSKCVPIKVNANLLFQNSKPNFFCTKDSDKNYNKAISNGIQSPGMFKKGSEQEANIGAIEKHRAKFNSKEEKEARMKLLQREITSNPEFFNAFPHLKEKIKLDYMESTNGTQEVEGFLNQNFFIKPSEESQEKKSNYFESLLNKHSGYSRVFKDESEKKLEDDGKFIDGYHTQTGPIKFMTREEKEKVHLEIDKKMRELEDSGLSRQEILFNEPEGIPLKQDKFYQFIKNNKIAREMLVKPTETFSVGINMPTKSVIFTDVCKFDGNGLRMLYPHEYTQMAGRAGRRGIDTIGNVFQLTNLFKILETQDYRMMMTGTPEKLVSKFKISYSFQISS